MRLVRLCVILIAAALGLSACGSPSPATQPVTDNTPIPTVRGEDPKMTNIPSGDIIIFTDAITGISLDYPEGWIMDQVRGGTRSPSVYVFTDYFHIPSLMDNIPEDQTAVYLTILQINPEMTLTALVDSYKQQWAKEGSTIASEENLTLNSGQPGTAFYLDSYLGKPYYYLFTAIGERLLFIEALGDLTPVPAIALTVR